MKNRGFSLIELIVVIFIIVILIALLYPAVQQARKNATFRNGNVVYNKITKEEGTIIRRTNQCMDCFLVRVKNDGIYSERTWTLEEFEKDSQ